MQRRETDAPRKITATPERAKQFVPLAPVAFFQGNQIEGELALPASYDRLAELFFVRCKDLDASFSPRNCDLPLLRV